MNKDQINSIRDVVRQIEGSLPENADGKTVDTFKSGNPDDAVRGIVVSFTATREVLARAVELGANFVITHEPTFYNHMDEVDFLEGDPAYFSKKDYLDRHGLVLWRFHDGWHRRRPDGILEGMVQRLGWSMPGPSEDPNLCLIEPLSLRELAGHCRKRLETGVVRVAGDLSMRCSRVALLPGACGGRRQMDVMRKAEADVVICGESPEWETCEYVRDATSAGIPKGLIVLGHANSEEAGMEFCAEWLRSLLPGSLPVHYVKAGDPFSGI